VSGYEELVELIDEELGAQVAIGRLGRIDPTPAQVRTTAELIASMVWIVFNVQKRDKPEFGPADDEERLAD
jgi:hypothetical protein